MSHRDMPIHEHRAFRYGSLLRSMAGMRDKGHYFPSYSTDDARQSDFVVYSSSGLTSLTDRLIGDVNRPEFDDSDLLPDQRELRAMTEAAAIQRQEKQRIEFADDAARYKAWLNEFRDRETQAAADALESDH